MAGGKKRETVRIENSSALTAMKRLEKWLSGRKRRVGRQSLGMQESIRRERFYLRVKSY